MTKQREAPFSEADIAFAVRTDLLAPASKAASILGLHSAFATVGSGTCVSDTDYLISWKGARDRQRLNALNSGCVEIKGDWQFAVAPGQSLAAALEDPESIDDCIRAIQQVWAWCPPCTVL